MRLRYCAGLLSCLLCLQITSTRGAVVRRITKLAQSVGSLGGGTLLTIYGSGFSENQFNFGDGNENLGNKVYMYAAAKGNTYMCDVHKDGCTANQIQCYTRPMDRMFYSVRITVDGADIPLENTCQTCYFIPGSGNTPTITKLRQQSGPPGSLIEMEGKIFTAFHDSTKLEANATNKNLNRIDRVYVGGQSCDLLNDRGDPYKLKLYGADGELDDGVMQCKLKGSYIGHLNMSFLVSGPYGRSVPAGSAMRVSSVGKIYMFMTYAEVTSISPAVGSNEGGTFLTVNGKNFDKTDAQPKVQVGGEPCKIVTSSDDKIVCKTSKKPSTLESKYPGNRGILFEKWVNTFKPYSKIDEIASLSTSGSGYTRKIIDEASWQQEETTQAFAARMRAFFFPPLSGKYSFKIDGSNEFKFYLSKTKNAQDKKEEMKQSKVDSSVYHRLRSGTYDFQKGQSYYMEVLYSGNGSVQAGLYQYSHTLSAVQTQNVHSEYQQIYMKSTERPEIQKISWNNLPSSSGSAEIQSVSLPIGSKFRLGMDGLYTDVLEEDDPVGIQRELNALPTIYPDSVSVVRTTNAASVTLRFTFRSERGPWPFISYKFDGNSATNSAIRTQTGSPSNKVVVFDYDGVASAPVPLTASAAQVKAALSDLLTPLCSRTISHPGSDVIMFHDYEDGRSVYSETVVKTTEAFCGRGVLDSPTFLYKVTSGFLLSSYRHVCFGYKRLSGFELQLGYKSGWSQRYPLFKNVFRQGDSWHYDCFDMYTLIENIDPSHVATAKILQVKVMRPEFITTRYFVDTVYIGSRKLVKGGQAENFMRLVPGFTADDVTVKQEATKSFSVTMKPAGGAANIKPFTLRNIASSAYSVQQTQQATPAISGTFDVRWKGHTMTGLPAQRTLTSADDIKEKLESLPGIGSLIVKLVPTANSYHNFRYDIDFRTAPGDQPLIEIVNRNLQGQDANVTCKLYRDGFITHQVIAGDYLRTIHDKPQVTLYINNIPTSCTADCTFEWSDQATPKITSLTPTSGSHGTNITMIGEGFDDTKEKNQISIGGGQCTVTSATTTQIQCDVDHNVAGMHDVDVIIKEKGLPTYQNGRYKFTYTAKITDIQPTSGSVGGGISLTISGTGFKKEAVVKLGQVQCMTKTITSTKIICITFPSSTASSVSVTVRQDNGDLTSTTKFSYVISNAVVSSIDVSTGKVEGGQVITVSGNGFGNDKGSVLVGEKPAEVTSYSDTRIVAVLPGLGHGQYPLIINVPNKGSADTSTNNIPLITYNFKVTGLSPTQGSLYGGSSVTITGEGFSSVRNNNNVKIGKHKCDVTSVSNTQVTCVIAPTSAVHIVTNNGTSNDKGEGYAWDKPELDVEVNDIIQWKWTAPHFVKNIAYRVEEIEGEFSRKPKTNGFSSGQAKSAKGLYTHRFTVPGTFHYWSGYVDPYNTVFMRGKVRVQDKTAGTDRMRFWIGAYEAVYEKGTTRRRRTASCPAITSTLPGCTVTGQAQNFSFVFTDCMSPKVTSISPNEGILTDTITIQGSGFGTDNCQNEVLIGSKTCDLITSSASSLTCKISPQQSLSAGVTHEVKVSVKGRGLALISISSDDHRRFVLKPQISSVSPNSGSTQGETLVTVSGSGFDGTTVTVTGASVCVVQSVTYTQVTCKTTVSRAGEHDVLLTTRGRRAQCPNGCKFSYAANKTPTVSSINPNSISQSGNTLTVKGSGFGSDKSLVIVKFGTIQCAVQSVTDTDATCTVDNLPVGSNPVYLHVTGKGRAAGSASVTGQAHIASIQPSTGGVNGGILTITGNGFVSGVTAVTIGGKPCTVRSVSLSQVTCQFPSLTEGVHNLNVSVNAVTYPSKTFTSSSANTPTVTQITPASGSAGDMVTVTGQRFSSTTSGNSVKLGEVTCAIQSSSSTQIVCTAGDAPAGPSNVTVHVTGKGLATSTAVFTYELQIQNIAPAEGSFGGGQKLTITGKGFHPEALVTICDAQCKVSANSTSTQLECETPSNNGIASNTKSCDVVVKRGGGEVVKSAGYTYTAAKTALITDVSPRRGGTAGGTRVTITGSGFGNDKAIVSVDIAGVPCPLITLTDQKAVCETNPKNPPTRTVILLSVGENGYATQDKADYWYIDVWSSRFTWGGQSPPVKGDFVVVSLGQTLLLDQDTPILKMLLIKGGVMIFDEKDIELKAENILITEGGKLQVGTEKKPFEHKGIITMHGRIRAPELPIYGAKTLALRNGTLDLHGKPVISWTVLAETAVANQNKIKLQIPVKTWKSGDVIVIATTGGHLSQSETEVRTIQSVSADGRLVTLTEDLQKTHLGEAQTFADGTVLQLRAEVGLLTRNVVFRGSNAREWNDKIKACPEGFDLGKFQVQTCSLGKSGEESGNDQFGAAIMVHQPRLSAGVVIARIAHVEITYAGQAFRLGRYPVHFHLNGRTSGSYVRGCAIHKTFNRAVNIHNTHNILVEHNFIYDIMGGAFFLEDSIETGNTFQYNLAVFVRASSSLLNDDVTPAAFWITNPDNTVIHNHVAGGSNFGFWYRMLEHPDGPSFTIDICPRKVPLKEFKNNTVHSCGWYGLWVFEHFHPTLSGTCAESNLTVAVFEDLVAWNSLRAAEWGDCPNCHFRNMVAANNYMAGFEMLFVGRGGRNTAPPFSEYGPALKNVTIIGHLNPLNHLNHTNRPLATRMGLVLPFFTGLLVDGVTFINFDEPGSRAIGQVVITCICGANCGGWTYRFKNVKWVNSPNKANMRWDANFKLDDIDGTLSRTGVANTRVIPASPLLPRAKCTTDAAGSGFSAGAHQAAICQPDVDVLRFSLHKIIPETMNFKNMVTTNRHGTLAVQWVRKREYQGEGWMVFLLVGEEHSIYFENADQISEFSYTGAVAALKKDDWVIVKYNLTQASKHFQNLPGTESIRNVSTAPLTKDNQDGDWYWDSSSKEISFLVKADDNLSANQIQMFRHIEFKLGDCVSDCLQGPDAGSTPPATSRPASALYWSAQQSWDKVPQNGDDVTIKRGVWMVADQPLPVTNVLSIYGVLELDDNTDSNGNRKNYDVIASVIYIEGGRLIVGWENKPFLGKVTITLVGQHSTPDFQYPAEAKGPKIGRKAIAVFGGLDLHGIKHKVNWTRLARTAYPGDTSIALSTAVDWFTGDEIVIATTSNWAWQTETFKVVGLSPDHTQLSLNASLRYKHLAYKEVILSIGKSYEMVAEVGLLTRNIKIIGQDYSALYKESFGARILVSSASTSNGTYTGYARLSNVEFYHTGQEGFTSLSDPRYSVTYLRTGTVSDVKPSYVIGCAFHHGFSPAIGVYDANGMNVDDNVIHHTVGQGMITQGSGHRIRRNLVVLSIHPAAYQDRNEITNYHTPAAIDIRKCHDVALQDNAVAGAEVVGMHTDGAPCSSRSSSDKYWRGNVIHSSLIGVLIDPFDCIVSEMCSKLSGFTIYRAQHFGIYYQSRCSIIVEESVLADNTIGFHPFVFGPDPIRHLYSDKFAHVIRSLFVGTSPVWNCTNDLIPADDTSYQITHRSRPWSVGPKGRVEGRTGITWPYAGGRKSVYPTKPWHSVKYPTAIKGILKVTDTSFAHFKPACRHTQSDVCFGTVPYHTNLNHPIETKTLKFYDVVEAGKVFIHRPDTKNIKHGVCGDMACDSKRKSILRDTDGSFFGGSPGGVIPQAEWQWDQAATYGLGDYRIPRTLLTDADGNRINIGNIVKSRGIFRDSSCTLKPAWQAYHCPGINYHIMVLESMDPDHLTRRLAPVSVVIDKVLDLTNGNRDLGYCFGYPCNKRLSTLPVVAVIGKSHTIDFTSTPPQKIRVFLLNADANKKIIISIYFPVRQKFNVMRTKVYVMPNNMEIDAKGATKYKYRANPSSLVPTVNSVSGANFFDITSNRMHVTVGGTDVYEIEMESVILLSMRVPPMTVDEFFGAGIINNLATFLGVSGPRIKMMNAIRETHSGRKKRATDSLNVQLEISKEVNTTNSTTPLRTLSNKLIESGQLGSLDSALNTTVLSVEVTEPIPDSNDTDWSRVVTKADSGTSSVVVTIAGAIVVDAEPVPLHEGEEFTAQPRLKVIDTSGNIMTELRSTAGSWKMKAFLSDNSTARLEGATEITVQDGWANFTNLLITHSGNDYVINFTVTGLSIPTPPRLTTQSAPLNITERPLAAKLSTQIVTQNEAFNLDVKIIDAITKNALQNIAWKGHTWTCTITPDVINQDMPQLNGPKTSTFEAILNKASFVGLTYNKVGDSIISIQVTSSPAGYSFKNSFIFSVYPQGYTAPVVSAWKSVQLTFDENYQVIVSGKEVQFVAAVHNVIRSDIRVSLRDFNVTEGSIKVDYNVTGSGADVDAYIGWLYKKLMAGMYVQFYNHNLEASKYLLVDGSLYTPSTPKDDKATIIIIIAVTASVLVLLFIVAAVIIITKKSKRMKKEVTPIGSSWKPTNPDLLRVKVEDDSHTRSPHHRPGSANSRPGSSHSESGPAHLRPGSAHSRPGSAHSQSGPAHLRPGSAHSRPGSAHTRPGSAHSHSGSDHSHPISTRSIQPHMDSRSPHADNAAQSRPSSSHSMSVSTHSSSPYIGSRKPLPTDEDHPGSETYP